MQRAWMRTIENGIYRESFASSEFRLLEDACTVVERNLSGEEHIFLFLPQSIIDYDLLPPFPPTYGFYLVYE